MAALLPLATRRSRWLLDWNAGACLAAAGRSLAAITGQTTTFARATATAALDANGASRYVPANLPAFQWVNDFVTGQLAPGLLIGADVVTLQPVPVTGTIYRRYFDRAAGMIVERVASYSAGTAIVFDVGVVHLVVRVAAGVQSLALMRGATIGAVPSAAVIPLVQTGMGVYEFTPGTAALELADVSGTGVYTLVAPGSSPGAVRVRAYQYGGTNLNVF